MRMLHIRVNARVIVERWDNGPGGGIYDEALRHVSSAAGPKCVGVHINDDDFAVTSVLYYYNADLTAPDMRTYTIYNTW